MKTRGKTLFLTQFGILLAIEAVFCFTPLGSIPLGVLVATLMCVPVIITAVLLGVKAGTLMGAFAGLFSFIVWTFTPPNPAVAFVFSPFASLGEFSGNIGSVIICFVPRILVGTVAGATFGAMKKIKGANDIVRYAVSAALGSLTNTVGVLGLIWLIFGEQYASVIGATILYIVGFLTLTNGLPEAVVSAILTPAICKPVKLILRQK